MNKNVKLNYKYLYYHRFILLASFFALFSFFVKIHQFFMSYDVKYEYG